MTFGFVQDLFLPFVYPGVLQASWECSRARDLLQTSPRGWSFSPRGLLQTSPVWLPANSVEEWPDRLKTISSPFFVCAFTLSSLLFIVLHCITFHLVMRIVLLIYSCFVPFLSEGFFSFCRPCSEILQYYSLFFNRPYAEHAEQ